MNSNSYPNPSSSGSNSSTNNPGYQPAINPALLASFQGSSSNQTQNSNQKSAAAGGGVNPAMLMGMNPAQMLQQMNGGGNNSMGMNFNGSMGGMGGGTGMNMGINPAALSSSIGAGMMQGQPQHHASHSQSHLQSQQMHPNLSQNSPSNPQGSSSQQQMNQLNPPAMPSAMGMTREQFSSLNHTERQAKMMMAAQMMGMGGMGNMGGGMGNMNGNMGNAAGGMGNMGGSMGAAGGMNVQGMPNPGGMRGAGMQNMQGIGNMSGMNMSGLGGSNNNVGGMGNVMGGGMSSGMGGMGGGMNNGMGGGMNNGMGGGMNNMGGMGMSNNMSAMGMSMLGSLMNSSPIASNGGNLANPQFNPASQNPQFYDRPSSAMSGGRHSSQQPQDRHQPSQSGAQTSSQPLQMMPPPPIRPQSRSLSSSSNPGSSGTPGIMPRPPSRDQAMMMMNGYNAGKPPQTPQQPHQQLQPQPSQSAPGQNPYPQHSAPGLSGQGLPGQGQSGQPQNRGSPPMPGSPYRGSKRKVGGDDSPRAGSVGLPGVGNMSGGMMGPPMNLPNTNGGYMPRPRSSMDQQSLGLGQPSIDRHPSGAERERQRQGSNPPSGTAIRQNSVPPSAKEGTRSSLPPAPQTATPTALTNTNTPRTNTPGPLSAAAQPPSAMPSLPPLPAGVSLNPVVTRVSIVPLHNSTQTIPAIDATEIQDIQGWMRTDKEYEVEFRKMKERMTEEARGVFGPAAAMWWEKGWVGVGGGLGALEKSRERRTGFDIRYPRRGERRERERGREGRKRREGLRLPRKLLQADAEKPELLVPIRLEFDVEHHKMRDTFVWNLNDPIVTPEHFAQSVVEDYNLPSSYHTVIVKSIQDQLSDYKAHTAGYDGDGGEITIIEDEETPDDYSAGRGLHQDGDSTWWHGWRKHVSHEIEVSAKRRRTRKVVAKGKAAEGTTGRGNLGEQNTGMKPDDRPMALDELELDEKLIHEDMRILIKLDIIIGSMKLDDQFEWDLDNANASPEEFATVYAKELGLGGEFRTAIAHSIREQVQIYQKSLFLVGHPSDGSPIQDEELRSSFLPNLTSGARPLDQVQSFTPLLNYLSDGEIERSEKDRDKDMNRRRKRNTRGRRGIALPDREPIRTYRTPAIGFPELDPATLALAAAANAPTSRRAAAAAASLNIANMVASENGTAFLAPMPAAPQPIIPAVAKEKRIKGLFKAPAYPPTVLRPRANVPAPTPHTAADVSKLPAPLENDPPPSAAVAPIDPKILKAMTAKRAKELEREAKEKEFADGQHPNHVDGIWHCSNCGCPEGIAIGRRKGPLGDKSQCGTCGKYWHRHRRPKPVVYNRNPEFHKRENELNKVAPVTSKKKAAPRGQNSTHPTTPAEEPSEPQSPPRSNGGVDITSRQSPHPILLPMDDDRAMSPVSSASSASEAPLAQRVKMNGTHAVSAPPASSRPSTPPSSTQAEVSQSASAPPPNTTLGSEPAPLSASPSRPSRPPQWLSEAMQTMQTTYPHDKFEIILRKVNPSTPPEWRIKCLDCPGKLYTPGPGETLSNYEVHLRNRLHRQRVNDRLNGTSSS